MYIKRHVSRAKYMRIYIYVVKQLKLGKTGDCVNLRSNSFHRRKYIFPPAGQTQPWDANGTSSRARPRPEPDLNSYHGHTIIGNGNCAVLTFVYPVFKFI